MGVNNINGIHTVPETVSTKTEFEQEPEQMFFFSPQEAKPTETGNTFSVLKVNGGSYLVNRDKGTITEYGPERQVINERAMTAKEKAMSPNKLMEQLIKSEKSPEIENKDQNRFIKDKGVSGSYNITETENGGYNIKMDMNVSTMSNPAAKVFLNGLKEDLGGKKNIKPDAQGYYNFRGIKAKTYNFLCSKALTAAQKIATQHAIYNDLQTKNKNGETLNNAEEKFIQDYKSLLEKHGLKINNNGELESL